MKRNLKDLAKRNGIVFKKSTNAYEPAKDHIVVLEELGPIRYITYDAKEMRWTVEVENGKEYGTTAEAKEYELYKIV